MALEVSFKKKLGSFQLDVSFASGTERVGLLGASGCGKSMTLKCIAGIETPDSGRIVINGRTVFDSKRNINVPPQQRRTGFLFQNYALFPHMTVERNIMLVLHRLQRSERERKTAEILERFGLTDCARLRPRQLSGGQQQRAALARMMVLEPEIIMLDEPFSALDFFLKHRIENELLELLKDFHGTLLFVSHNRDEIYRICTQMQIISRGHICRGGSCTEIFEDPQTVAAAQLTGCKNIAPCIRISDTEIEVPDWNLRLCTARPVPPTVTHAGIRAHFIRPPCAGEHINVFEFTVIGRRSSPFSVSEYLTVPGGVLPLDRELEISSPSASSSDNMNEPGGKKLLCLPPESVLLLTDR